MKVIANYKGKSVELDIPDEKLEELVKEQKKTGWEKAKRNSDYFAIISTGEVDKDTEYNTIIDTNKYDRGNYFTSKELAENIARYQSLDLRIRRRIAEICKPLNWTDNTVLKYGVFYNYKNRRAEWYGSHGRYCPWNCDTEEHAEQIIEEFKDELIWYFTEFKDRMDS